MDSKGGRNEWDINQIYQKVEAIEKQMRDNAGKIHDLELFRESTAQKLLTIFSELKDLQDGDKWIKRLIIGSLITGAVGAVFSFLVWAVQS